MAEDKLDIFVTNSKKIIKIIDKLQEDFFLLDEPKLAVFSCLILCDLFEGKKTVVIVSLKSQQHGIDTPI